MIVPHHAMETLTPASVISTRKIPPGRGTTALHFVSLAFLVIWCVWWALSIERGELAGVRRGWMLRCFTPETFGGDFIWHVDSPTRLWLSGENPYDAKGDGDILLYPPLVLRAFAWVELLNSHRGRAIWMAALALMTAVSCRRVWNDRKRLGLEEWPFSTVLAAMLFSTPVVFAMERGQFDLVTAPLVLAGLALIRHESRIGQWMAGAVMAVAPLLKVYPGILGAGLLGLRRGRVLAGFVIAGLAVSVALRDETRQFLGNIDLHSGKARAFLQWDQGTLVHPWNHSIPDNWQRVWRDTPLRFLSRIPGHLAAAVILGTLLVAVSRRVSQCAERDVLAFPYLMWIVAVGAFVPPMANSYNLMFLPLAAIAVCSRRDPLPCRLLFWGSLVWLVPVELPVEGRWLFLMKIGTLAAVGWSLVQRANELTARRVEPRDTINNRESSDKLAA